MRNAAIPAAYLLLVKDDAVLIARRCNTGYQDGNYQIPAGHVEAGELPSEALIREAKEEIGIEIAPDDVQLVHVCYRPKHDATGDRADYFFRVERWEGEVTNQEPHKCDDLRWVSPDELPDNMTLHVKEAIQCVRRGVFYNEIPLARLKAAGLFIPW